MLPPERGDVGEQFVRHVDAGRAQMPHGAVEIDGVPQRHRGRDQRQPRGAVPLVARPLRRTRRTHPIRRLDPKRTQGEQTAFLQEGAWIISDSSARDQ